MVVAQGGVNLIGGVAGEEDGLADGGAGQLIQEVRQEGPAGDGGQHLGAVGDRVAQARPQPSCEHRGRYVVKRSRHADSPAPWRRAFLG